MNIDKNIAAKLKREMSKRGVNYAEFAEELGIPRTTMQGYVLVRRNSTSKSVLSALVAPFSSDRADVLDLIDRCAKAQLPPAKLVDEVQNFPAR